MIMRSRSFSTIHTAGFTHGVLRGGLFIMRLFFLALILFATTAATSLEADTQTLAPSPGPHHAVVTADDACATIVIPEDPDWLEEYAANELQRYVKKITGKELVIESEGEQLSGFGIWLGHTDSAEQAGLVPGEAELARDGYAARCDDSGLVVCGASPLGTLFGVYDIVEREFGVRWFQPGTSDEYVPESPTLSIGTFNRRVRPSFEFRWIHNSDWSLKQRMNCHVKVDSRPVGVNWKWHFHTFAILIPPEKYSREHPEWFAMVDGERQTYDKRPSHGAQLCTTNPDVIDKLAEGMITTLDADPSIDIITLSPNDGGGFCECPKCTALDEPERGWFAKYSKRLAILDKEISRRVAQEHPDVLIKVGAYAMYALPPDISGWRPEPNQIIQLCHIYFCHNHPITSDKCQPGEAYEPSHNFLPNQRFAELTRQWAGLTDNLFIYEYYALGGWSKTNMLWPMVHTMRHDIPFYRDCGARGFYTQVADWPRSPLNYYVAAKLAWNADLDVDWLVDDFCRSFFGQAAEPMKAYLMGLEQVMTEGDCCISYGLRAGRAKRLGPRLFDEAARTRLRKFLDQAHDQAVSDEVTQRILPIRNAFDACEASVLELTGQ